MSKHRPPLLTNRRTSPGYSKVPLAEATAGKLYRVRDEDWGRVWGDNLTWQDAKKLKERVAAKRLSRTVCVEDMAVAPPLNVKVTATRAQDGHIELEVAQRTALDAVRKAIQATNGAAERTVVVDVEHVIDDLVDVADLHGGDPSDDDLDAAIDAAR